MPKYLITGGAGFIGSHLAELLIASGHSVRVLDNLSTGKSENVPRNAHLLIGDAADPDVVKKALDGVDGVFHLAAISSVAASTADWLGSHRANQTAALTVLDAARMAGRIPVVLASSAAVYGESDELPLRESAKLRPVTVYGADKLASELHAYVAWRAYGVPNAVLRLFNIFGDRQDPSSPYSGVISIFIDRLLRGAPLMIYGDGRHTRDFVYVTDAVRCFHAAMASLEKSPRATLSNVCTGVSVPIELAAREIAQLVGQKQLDLQFCAGRPGDILHSRGDPSLAEHEFGFRSKTTFKSGLVKLLKSKGVGQDACYDGD